MKKSKTFLFIILLVLNLVIVQIFDFLSFYQVLIIQIFLFFLSFLVDIIQLKFSKNKNITPAHFLMINFLRILLCVVFLLPIILKYSKSDNSYIYNFFIAYFIYLFHDIIFKGKSLNKING
tara:strand:- start:552 stop:914 length:363 start_codon:yes stop_codon:yes gene_type:complete